MSWRVQSPHWLDDADQLEALHLVTAAADGEIRTLGINPGEHPELRQVLVTDARRCLLAEANWLAIGPGQIGKGYWPIDVPFGAN